MPRRKLVAACMGLYFYAWAGCLDTVSACLLGFFRIKVVSPLDKPLGSLFFMCQRILGRILALPNRESKMQEVNPMTDKSTAENMLDAAKNKLDEAGDRARAAVHDVKARLSDNPVDTAAEKVKAGVDRAKAEVSNAKAHANYQEGKKEATDGDGH